MKRILLCIVLIFLSCCPLSWCQEFPEIISYPLSKAPDGPYDHGNMACADGRIWLPTDGGLISVGAPTGDVRWYSLADGLPGETVFTLVSDAQDRLWCQVWPGQSASDGAICMFDGLAFSSSVQIPHPKGLAAGADGSVWAIGDSRPCRLLRWNGGRPDDWTSYNLTDYGLPVNWGADRGLFVDRAGCVWFAGSSNLVEFCEGVLTVYDIPGDLNSSYYADIMSDEKGRIWWISNTWHGHDRPIGRIACYDHGEWRSFSGEALAVGYFTCLAEAPEGTLVAGSDRGLFLFDGDQLTQFGTEDGLPFDWVMDVIVDPNGNLWAWCIPALRGISLGALAKYDGARIDVYPVEPHPLAAHGTPQTVDDEGRVWFASESGFSSFLIGEWESIPVALPLRLEEMSVAPDRAIWWAFADAAWLPSYEGIWRAANGEIRQFDDDEGLPLDRCWDLEIDSKGVVWAVGQDDGPYRQYISSFDGSKWENWDDLNGMNDQWCFNYSDLAVDLDDSVWCAAGWVDAETILGGGACQLTRAEVTYYVPPDTGYWGPRLGAAAVAPDGTKWFLKLEQDPNGIYGGTGLFGYDGAKWVWKRDRDLLSLSSSIDPPLYADSFGKVWMSFMAGDPDPGEGLLCYDPGTDSRIRYTVADGLGSPYVNRVLMDADDNIWVEGGSVHPYTGPWSTAVSILLADGNIELGAKTDEAQYSPGDTMTASMSWLYRGPSMPADLYVALQAPSGQIFYVARQEAEPPFPIFYAAFEGSTDFLEPGPDYDGPGSIPNTPEMKDLAPSRLPLPDPSGLALFAYPVPYFANVPLPAYSAIEDLVLLNTTLPEDAPAGTYTFHVGITAPSSISNVYRTASTTFDVSNE